MGISHLWLPALFFLAAVVGCSALEPAATPAPPPTPETIIDPRLGHTLYLCPEMVEQPQSTRPPNPWGAPQPTFLPFMRATGEVFSCSYKMRPEEVVLWLRRNGGPSLSLREVIGLRVAHESLQLHTYERAGHILNFAVQCNRFSRKASILREYPELTREICRFYCADVGQACFQLGLFRNSSLDHR